jgi:hypothetical protein
MPAPTTPDLDSLIAELQRLRAEHGNLPAVLQAGSNPLWLQLPSVSVISIGLKKGPPTPVSRGGRPALLLRATSY